jgi:DNA-binding XRE family transcriptional regulator
MISEEQLYAGLGQRIRSYREGQGGVGRMTQAELAHLVGLERTSITNIEKGTQKVPLHILYRMCEVFKVDISAALPSVEEVREENQDEWSSVDNSGVKLPPQAARVYSTILSQILK